MSPVTDNATSADVPLGLVGHGKSLRSFDSLPFTQTYDLSEVEGANSDFVRRHGHWLIFNNGSARGSELATRFQEQGAAVTVARSADLEAQGLQTAQTLSRHAPFQDRLEDVARSRRRSARGWALDGPAVPLISALPRSVSWLPKSPAYHAMIAALGVGDPRVIRAATARSFVQDTTPALRLAYRRVQDKLWRDRVYAQSSQLFLATRPDIPDRVGAHFRLPPVTIFVPTKRADRIDFILENYDRARWHTKELIICVHSDVFPEAIDTHLQGRSDVRVFNMPERFNVGACMNEALRRARYPFAVKMDDDDIYGARYVEDMVLAWHTTGADFIGKPPLLFYFEASDETYLQGAGGRFELVTCQMSDVAARKVSLSGSTHSGPLKTFLEHPFCEDKHGRVDRDTYERHAASGLEVATASGLNVITWRYANAKHHTWKVSDEELKKDGVALGSGIATDLAMA